MYLYPSHLLCISNHVSLSRYIYNSNLDLISWCLSISTHIVQFNLSHVICVSLQVNEIDNRGSTFYLCLYWAQALARQSEDAALKERMSALAEELQVLILSHNIICIYCVCIYRWIDRQI